MTKKNYFLSADFQATPTDTSRRQKVVCLVIQSYARLVLSWMAFNEVTVPKNRQTEVFCLIKDLAVASYRLRLFIQIFVLYSLL